MKGRGSVALGIVAVAIIAAQCAEIRDVRGNQRATLQRLADAEARTAIWQSKYAEAASTVQRDVDTVVVRIRQVSELRDTLRITDTLQVISYIARTDSALAACSDLASSCTQFRLSADSLLGAKDRQYDALAKYAESVKPSAIQRFWWATAIAGVVIGAWIRGQP